MPKRHQWILEEMVVMMILIMVWEAIYVEK